MAQHLFAHLTRPVTLRVSRPAALGLGGAVIAIIVGVRRFSHGHRLRIASRISIRRFCGMMRASPSQRNSRSTRRNRRAA